MAEVSIAIAFLAGLVSFLSPCVFPIIPGFLAYLAGAASAEEVKAKRKEIFLNSVFFVLGFSIVFSLLGVLLNTVLERVAYDAQVWLARIGGIIIIFFGLYLVGLIKIPFLERAHTIRVKTKFSSRYLTSLFFGTAFAAGWTPCVGAALGAILALAATQPANAFVLLFSYSLGLGIPFLLVGAFTSQTTVFINKYANAMNFIKIFFGIVLIVLGILAFTQQLPLISNIDAIKNVFSQ